MDGEKNVNTPNCQPTCTRSKVRVRIDFRRRSRFYAAPGVPGRRGGDSRPLSAAERRRPRHVRTWVIAIANRRRFKNRYTVGDTPAYYLYIPTLLLMLLTVGKNKNTNEWFAVVPYVFRVRELYYVCGWCEGPKMHVSSCAGWTWTPVRTCVGVCFRWRWRERERESWFRYVIVTSSFILLGRKCAFKYPTQCCWWCRLIVEIRIYFLSITIDFFGSPEQEIIE